MIKITAVELKLLLREPAALFFTLVLPLGLLLGLGSLPDYQKTIPGLSNQRIIDTQLPAMMIVLAVVTTAFTLLPAALVGYRETGVLRRMSTTPVRPGKLLTAQLVINVAVAVVATALMVVLGNVVHGIALPRQMAGFLLTFVLGCASIFAVGLLIAALAPNAKAAPGIGSLLMFPMLFIGGVWMAREMMPDLLRQIGDFLPVAPFGQALRDTWAGAAPQPLHLIVMTATLILFGGAAVRLFRWE
jgi:ABC-2 type transport system permease protein